MTGFHIIVLILVIVIGAPFMYITLTTIRVVIETIREIVYNTYLYLRTCYLYIKDQMIRMLK